MEFDTINMRPRGLTKRAYNYTKTLIAAPNSSSSYLAYIGFVRGSFRKNQPFGPQPDTIDHTKEFDDVDPYTNHLILAYKREKSVCEAFKNIFAFFTLPGLFFFVPLTGCYQMRSRSLWQWQWPAEANLRHRAAKRESSNQLSEYHSAS